MIAPWMRQPGSTINQIPKPCSYTTGLTGYQVAYLVFRERLEQYNQHGGSERTRWVLDQYNNLRDRYGAEWDGVGPNLDLRPVEFFDDLEGCYHEATKYFRGLQDNSVK